MKIYKILSLCLILIIATGCVYDPDNDFQNGNFEDLFDFEDKQLRDVLIDLRKEEDYLRGHRGQAISIPLREVQRGNFNLTGYEDRKITLYGNFEREAEEAAGYFRDLGFEEVYVDPGVKEADYTPVVYKAILGPAFERVILSDEDFYLIDTREPEDYNESHIVGAVNITGQEFGDKLDSVPKNGPIYVYGYESDNEFARALTDYRDDVTLVLEGTDLYDYQEFYNFNN